MFLVACLIMPLWLGSSTATGKAFYGLFYRIECGHTHCVTEDATLDSDTVPLNGRDWNGKESIHFIVNTMYIIMKIRSPRCA